MSNNQPIQGDPEGQSPEFTPESTTNIDRCETSNFKQLSVRKKFNGGVLQLTVESLEEDCDVGAMDVALKEVSDFAVQKLASFVSHDPSLDRPAGLEALLQSAIGGLGGVAVRIPGGYPGFVPGGNPMPDDAGEEDL